MSADLLVAIPAGRGGTAAEVPVVGGWGCVRSGYAQSEVTLSVQTNDPAVARAFASAWSDVADRLEQDELLATVAAHSDAIEQLSETRT
jgi:hypothetical protein